jgi:protein-tyrosine-phosphatase/DNA-binding transcriptional ArsR family regulator
VESKEIAEGFAALAQETRLSLVRALVACGPDGMAAGDVASKLGLAPSTLSFHLSALEQAGLIQSTRQGRHIIYAVRFAGLRALFAYLTETCCGDRPELCSDLARLLPDPEPPEDRMTGTFNLLFLCTHNSARSLMAEAILTQLGRGRFNVYSAGSEPASRPMPEVIEKLRALGHDTSRLRCKSWDEFTGPNAPRMDFVITLCDTPQGQVCPDFGDRPVTAAWPLPDPAKFSGSAVEQATMINALYGMIRRRLEIFINLPYTALDRLALKKRLDELGDSARASS